MGFCGRCGAETKEGADYCPECGAPLRAGIAPKPSPGRKLIPIAALIVAAILVAAGVYYILNDDNSRPATEDSYIITFSVEDLVIHSDDGTLYNIQQDGKYYNPESKEFELDEPCPYANLVLEVSIGSAPYTSAPFRIDVNGEAMDRQIQLDIPPVNGTSSVEITVFLTTEPNAAGEKGSVISILSGSQSQTGASLTIDLNKRTSVLELTGGPQPYASGKLVISVTPA